jgi:hyaluronan synthase
MDAFCYTKAPTTLTGYFNQQLRWKRSTIIDFTCGLGHAWRLHPLVGLHYLSLFAVLLIYPFVILAHLANGDFLPLVTMHLGVIALLGFVYWLSPATRRLAPAQRVHPIWFLPMAVLMPTAYVVMTPLALFTLHSSSWETRGHSAVVARGGAGGGGRP